KKLMVHAAEVEQFSRTKSYRDGLSELELLFIKKLGEVEKVTFLIPSILKGEDLGMMKKLGENLIKLRISFWEEAKQAAKENPKLATTKTGRKKKEKGEPSIKLAKGETYEITYSLSEEGKSIEEISEARGLAESTIKGHLAKGITAGKVSIHQHLSKELIHKVGELIKLKDGDLGAVRQESPEQYDYGTLKMVAAFLSK